MKRKVFLIETAMVFLSIFFVQLLPAQNVAPYWSITGNTNALTTSKLGTVNAVPLRIMTKGTEWMRIDTLGRVGIGTTAPTQKLNVVGHVFITGNIGLGVTPTQKLHVSGNGIITGNLGLGVTPTQKLHVSGNGLITGNLGLGITPTQKLHVSGNAIITGNVGLGITPTQKLHVSGNAVFTDRVGIGITTPAFALDVRTATSCFGQIKATSGYAGVVVDKSDVAQNGYLICRTAGVDRWTVGTRGNDNFSVRNWILAADALTIDIANNNVGIGVGSLSSKLNVYSVDTYAGSFTSTNSWGLVASTTNGVYAGVFYGSVWSSVGYQTSDKNLKKDIQDFTDAMSIINKLKPTNYLFKDDEKYASLHLPKGRHYGLLAQDLEQVLPNLISEAPHELIDESKPAINESKPATVVTATDVKSTADGNPQPITLETKETINIKAVNYVELIPILVKGMQEQDVKMKEQDIEIANLKNEINELRALILKNANDITGTPVVDYLKQNNPNPTNENTTIKYSTPNDARNAQISITDINGNVLKTYRVPTGEGQLIIKKGELANGTYNYTLYVNNNKIDTKRMIVIR